MPKHDLDKIARDFRAASAEIDPGDNVMTALHLRGSEAELALYLWLFAERNAGRVTTCQMSSAFGSLVGAALYNYLLHFPEELRNHHLEHFFNCLGDTLNQPQIVGQVETVSFPGNSGLH